MKLGLVGAGAIAQSYVQALRESEVARVGAVADVRDEAARTLAEDAGCAFFASHKDLCDQGGCEAVIVCTPPATHPEICIDLLDQEFRSCVRSRSARILPAPARWSRQRRRRMSSSRWLRNSGMWTT